MAATKPPAVESNSVPSTLEPARVRTGEHAHHHVPALPTRHRAGSSRVGGSRDRVTVYGGPAAVSRVATGRDGERLWRAMIAACIDQVIAPAHAPADMWSVVEGDRDVTDDDREETVYHGPYVTTLSRAFEAALHSLDPDPTLLAAISQHCAQCGTRSGISEVDKNAGTPSPRSAARTDR